MKMPTQVQMYYHASRAAAETNETFLELVQLGMTKQDLETNIKRRPSLWQQFSGWLDKLPDSQEVWEEENDIYVQYMESGAYYDTGSETFNARLYEEYLRTFTQLNIH